MLACAGAAGLALLFVVIARVRGRVSRIGRLLLGLSCVGFLGTATAGTSERIAASRASATEVVAEATVEDKQNVAPAEDVKAEPPPAEDVKAEPPPVEELKAEPPPAQDANAEPPPPVEEAKAEPPPPAVESAAEALPTDKKERATTIWKLLRSAHLAAEDAGKCEDPQEVAAAWRALAPIVADEKERGKAKAAIKKLEACRKKIVWARAYAIGRERLARRDAFVDVVVERLAKRDIAAVAGLLGMKHEKLRVGGRKLDAPTAEALLAEGLKDELAEMGFELVTLTDTKKGTRVELEPESDADIAARELAPQGLDQPLALPR